MEQKVWKIQTFEHELSEVCEGPYWISCGGLLPAAMPSPSGKFGKNKLEFSFSFVGKCVKVKYSLLLSFAGKCGQLDLQKWTFRGWEQECWLSSEEAECRKSVSCLWCVWRRGWGTQTVKRNLHKTPLWQLWAFCWSLPVQNGSQDCASSSPLWAKLEQWGWHEGWSGTGVFSIVIEYWSPIAGEDWGIWLEFRN